MDALELVRGLIKALQTPMIVLLPKIVSNVNLKTVNYSHKRIILDSWLGPGCTSADWYITALKVKTRMCKHSRQVKMKSF